MTYISRTLRIENWLLEALIVGVPVACVGIGIGIGWLIWRG